MATYMYNPSGDAKARLKTPRLFTTAQWTDTTWDEALAIYRELGLPVLFVGVGEGIDDLIPFEPSEYARALLGDS